MLDFRCFLNKNKNRAKKSAKFAQNRRKNFKINLHCICLLLYLCDEIKN
jgi:hypothetical protein